MPYIRVSASKPATAEQELALKAGLARAVELIPGKKEALLMVEIAAGQTMFYRGERGDFAFIDARFSGEIPFEQQKTFTEAAIKTAAEVLGLSVDSVNLTFLCFDAWGTKGTLLGR